LLIVFAHPKQGTAQTPAKLCDQSTPIDLHVTLPDASGAPHSVGGLINQVTVINLVATWFKGSAAEARVFNEFSRLNGQAGESTARVVGIVLDDSERTFAAYVAANQPNYMLLWRASSPGFSTAFEQWMHRAPSTIIVRPDSTVCTVIVGRASVEVLKAAVKAAAYRDQAPQMTAPNRRQ
jgi:hypothetical protein